MDQFEKGMDWIKGLAGEEAAKAGSVVAWQCIATTINELVEHFNTITFMSQRTEFKRNRQVQLKKIIIGMIFEINDCLGQWTAELRKHELFDDNLKNLKSTFESCCKKVGIAQLKDIRNGVAFHFKESLTDPDAIVELYMKIDRIPICTLREIVDAAHSCGRAMCDKVVKNLSTTN